MIHIQPWETFFGGKVIRVWPAARIFRAIEERGWAYRYLAWREIDDGFLGKLETVIVVAEIRDRREQEWALPDHGAVNTGGLTTQVWPRSPTNGHGSYDAEYQPAVQVAPLLRETDIASLLRQWSADDELSVPPQSGRSRLGEVVLEHAISGELGRRRIDLTLDVVDRLVAKDLLGVRGRLFAGKVYQANGRTSEAEAVWERLLGDYKHIPATAVLLGELIRKTREIS